MTIVYGFLQLFLNVSERNIKEKLKETINNCLLGNAYEITTPHDWYYITRPQIYEAGGASLLAGRYNGSLLKALGTIYPQISWNSWRFSRPHNVSKHERVYSKTQKLLYNQLRTVLFLMKLRIS